MPWLLKSPEQQQVWYWLCRTDNMYSCSSINFIYLGWATSKTRFKMWIQCISSVIFEIIQHFKSTMHVCVHTFWNYTLSLSWWQWSETKHNTEINFFVIFIHSIPRVVKWHQCIYILTKPAECIGIGYWQWKKKIFPIVHYIVELNRNKKPAPPWDSETQDVHLKL